MVFCSLEKKCDYTAVQFKFSLFLMRSFGAEMKQCIHLEFWPRDIASHAGNLLSASNVRHRLGH